MEEPSLVSVRRRKPSAGTEHLAESAGANRADSSRPSGDHVAQTRGQLRRRAGIRLQLQLSAGHRPNSAPGRESPARAALWSTSHRYLTSPGPAPAGDTDRGLRSSSPQAQTRHAWAGCVESLLRPADDLSPQNLIRRRRSCAAAAILIHVRFRVTPFPSLLCRSCYRCIRSESIRPKTVTNLPV